MFQPPFDDSSQTNRDPSRPRANASFLLFRSQHSGHHTDAAPLIENGSAGGEAGGGTGTELIMSSTPSSAAERRRVTSPASATRRSYLHIGDAANNVPPVRSAKNNALQEMTAAFESVRKAQESANKVPQGIGFWGNVKQKVSSNWRRFADATWSKKGKQVASVVTTGVEATTAGVLSYGNGVPPYWNSAYAAFGKIAHQITPSVPGWLESVGGWIARAGVVSVNTVQGGAVFVIVSTKAKEFFSRSPALRDLQADPEKSLTRQMIVTVSKELAKIACVLPTAAGFYALSLPLDDNGMVKTDVTAKQQADAFFAFVVNGIIFYIGIDALFQFIYEKGLYVTDELKRREWFGLQASDEDQLRLTSEEVKRILIGRLERFEQKGYKSLVNPGVDGQTKLLTFNDIVLAIGQGFYLPPEVELGRHVAVEGGAGSEPQPTSRLQELMPTLTSDKPPVRQNPLRTAAYYIVKYGAVAITVGSLAGYIRVMGQGGKLLAIMWDLPGDPDLYATISKIGGGFSMGGMTYRAVTSIVDSAFERKQRSAAQIVHPTLYNILWVINAGLSANSGWTGAYTNYGILAPAIIDLLYQGTAGVTSGMTNYFFNKYLLEIALSSRALTRVEDQPILMWKIAIERTKNLIKTINDKQLVRVFKDQSWPQEIRVQVLDVVAEKAKSGMPNNLSFAQVLMQYSETGRRIKGTRLELPVAPNPSTTARLVQNPNSNPVELRAV